jgi:hypothetical protein
MKSPLTKSLRKQLKMLRQFEQALGSSNSDEKQKQL